MAPSETTCPACEQNALALEGRSDWAVAKTRTGVVWLNPNQHYRGAAFFVADECVSEIHQLDPEKRTEHLREMAEVAEAVARSTGAVKMNYEALGNSVPHLHWWLTPRYADDPRPNRPIWENPDFLLAEQSGGTPLDESERRSMQGRLLAALARQDLDLTPLVRDPADGASAPVARASRSTRTGRELNTAGWNRVLLALVVAVAAYGVGLVVAGGFIGDRLFDALGFGPDDGRIPRGVPYDYVRFVYGVLGAVIVGWMTVVAAMATGPLRRHERWAWWTVAGSLTSWFVLDTILSLVFGFVGHALFNVGFAVSLAVPMAALRPRGR